MLGCGQGPVLDHMSTSRFVNELGNLLTLTWVVVQWFIFMLVMFMGYRWGQRLGISHPSRGDTFRYLFEALGLRRKSQ